MIKKMLTVTLVFALMFTSSAFAYRWINDENIWYVVDESTGEFLKNVLVDVVDNVYYLDEEGKMVTGWWRNDTSGKYYYFSNKNDSSYGAMLFGLHMIDGYYHYFADDGSLVVANELGSYIRAYDEYYADINGKLYSDNKLMRDVSKARSEYYSNPIYYDEPSLNNNYLANYDLNFHELIVEPVKEKHVINNNVINNNTIRNQNASSSNTENQTSSASSSINRSDGGLEKIGPRANMR